MSLKLLAVLLCGPGLLSASHCVAGSGAETAGRPLDRSHFVFVRGCLSESGEKDGKPPCTGPGGWGEYAELLQEAYDASRTQGDPDFQTWSRTHRHDIASRGAIDAADQLKHLIDDDRVISPGSAVHLLGHSAGGAGVMEYLLREAVRGSYGCRVPGPCAKRIATATTIDAPLGGRGGQWTKALAVGFGGGLPIWGGVWQAWAGRGCFIYNVCTAPNDTLSGPLPMCESEPACRFRLLLGSEYPSPPRELSPSEWHSWSFRHLARPVREHLRDLWRR